MTWPEKAELTATIRQMQPREASGALPVDQRGERSIAES